MTLDREDALNRVAYAMQTFVSTVLDRRMLSGLGNLLEMFKADRAQPGTQLANFVGRTASGFVVPNATKWVDQVFDPQLYTPDSVQGAALANVPVARRLNRPALNVSGEPLRRDPFGRFTQPGQPDERVRTLASKNAWVSMPDIDEQVVGDKNRGEDWYRPMTPEEYNDWIEESGTRIRERLEMSLPRLQTMEAEEAQGFVRKVASEERRRAKRYFRP